MNFQNLTLALLPSAVRLSTQAGWNQTQDDWHRLIRLAPGGVKVWTRDGEVRASYSVYGISPRVAWIGMVLVDREFRGQGLGRTLFTHALQDAGDGGYAVLGLDATELGEPIYRKFGFEVQSSIVRWQGILSPVKTATFRSRLRQGFHPAIVDLDARLLGEDRSALLADLAERDGTFLRLEEDGKILAYAVLRSGRTATQIGPVVAVTRQNFAEIFKEIAWIYSGREVMCDVVHEAASPVLSASGLLPRRLLKRMTALRQDHCLCGDGIWCAAGFELG